MRKLLPALSLLALLAAAPAPAGAAATRSTALTPAPLSAPGAALTPTVLARRGFGGARRRYNSRPGYGNRPYRRPSGRGFFGGVLRALGIAYLVNLLFGWGPGGGSPFGLFLLLGLVALFVTMRRRRPAMRY